MADPKRLLWVDLETTGTDERLDQIIEVGAIITDLQLDELYRYQAIIQIGAQPYNRLLSNATVWEMHQENGLIDDCATTYETLATVDRDLSRHLAHWGEPHDYMIAGSGVGHFDRRFIRQQLPQVESYLQYPALDVGVIRRAMAMWAGEGLDFKMNEGKAHRAMADIEQHLAEGLAYRSLFRQWGRTI